jgi:flagellar motor switch protein FliM
MSRRGQGGGPAPYDFRRPIKLSREHVRTLQIAFETYARSCGTLLTTRLRVVSSVTLPPIEQLNYDEYVASLANPTVIAVGTSTRCPARLMEMSSSAVMTAIDHMLGGPADPSGAAADRGRDAAAARPAGRMLGELRYGFETWFDIRPKLKGDRVHAPVPARARAGDACVVATFDLKIGRRGVPWPASACRSTDLPVLSRTEAVVLSRQGAASRDPRPAQPHGRTLRGADRRCGAIPAHSHAYR